jgi:hypothetical protein
MAKRVSQSKLPKRSRKRRVHHKAKKPNHLSSGFEAALAEHYSSIVLMRGIGVLLDILAPVGGFGQHPKTQAPESKRIDPANVVTLHQNDDGEYA